MKKFAAGVLACLIIGVFGCGGGGGSSTPPGSSGILVTKAAGGTVAAGNASVVIQPGALAADTKIWVQPAPDTVPPAPTKLQILGGTAYDLSPNGTTFSTSAALTIRYNPKSLPSGVPESTVAIYTVVSSVWQKVSGSVVDPVAHTVSVPVAHFSVYAALCPQYIGSGPLYDVVNLGTLPGDAGSTPNGISSDGKVVGLSTSSKGVLHAFLWANSNITNLGTRPGDIWAIAYGVNASGVAVGISLPDNSNAYPVQFYQGQVTQLETAFGLIEGSATAINDHGDYIVSNALSQGGTVTQLVGFTRSTSSGALNNSGAVAGTLQSHAAIWTGGNITDVGLLPNYDSTEGTAISNNGSLVGNADIGGSGKPVGFLYQGGTMSKVSPVTGDNIARPTGVNDAGQVVGTSTLDDAGTHGFVYQNGVTQSLTDLIDPQSGWQITYAYGINNAGQIIAKGFNNGSQQAILLNPKTPPALGALAWFKPPVRKKR